MVPGRHGRHVFYCLPAAERNQYRRLSGLLPLFLEGFGRGTWTVRREPVDAATMEADIAAMLRDPAIELLQIRNAEAGCFIARVERV